MSFIEQWKKAKATKTLRGRRIGLEALGERLVLTGFTAPPPQVVTFTFSAGLLDVAGDDQSGIINLDVENGVVLVNGVSTGKTDADISAIRARGFGGDDTIRARLPRGFQAACTLEGGAGGDDLTGSDGNDVLRGGDGNDRLFANDGDDILDGGNDIDRLEGGDGDDTLTGGAGFDRFDGGRGLDTLIENFGAFSPTAGVNLRFQFGPLGVLQFREEFSNGVIVEEDLSDINRFHLTGTPLADVIDLSGITNLDIFETTLNGGAGADVLLGTDASDLLIGGAGDDILSSFGGNDVLVPGAGNDLVGGGAGFDVLRNVAVSATDANFDSRFSGNVFITLTNDSMLAETVTGTNLHEQLFADVESVELTTLASGAVVDVSNFTKKLSFDGGADNDRVISRGQSGVQLTNTSLRRSSGGAALPEIVLAGVERADFVGTVGNDTISAQSFSGAVVIDGQAGADFILGGAGPDVLLGGLGDDTIFGANGNDRIEGGFGDDRLDGGAGNDTISGGFGDDTLIGGGGSDTLDGGPGTDGIEVRGTAGDDVITIGRRNRPGGARALVTVNGVTQAFRYVNGETVTVFAGAGNDVVQMADCVGSTWRALFYGEDGDDVLTGGASSDTLDGGAGHDLLHGRAGADRYVADDGMLDMVFADLADLLDRLDEHDLVLGRPR